MREPNPRSSPPASAAPTVYVVDSSAAVRTALRAMLDSAGYRVTLFENGDAFLGSMDKLEGGCAIIDIELAPMDGFEVFRRLARNLPEVPVILTSSSGAMNQAVRALKAGAIDYIEKPFEPQHLLNSIAKAIERQQQSYGEVVERRKAVTLLQRLTPRESEILERLMLGDSTKAIARQLDISPRTVEVHRAHIVEKLEARNTADAIKTATQGRLGSNGHSGPHRP